MTHLRHSDILKQPITTLLATFGALLTLLTIRALGRPYATESVEGVLSPVGVWMDSLAGPFLSAVMVLMALLGGSVIMIRIINRYSLSVVRSFMPLVLYVICIVGVVYPIGSPALMIALLMLTHATDKTFLSFKRHECFGEVMSASFWTAMAALLVPDLSVLLLLLPLQWAVWQRSAREMIASVIMIPLPLLLASSLYWFGGAPFFGLVGEWSESFSGFRLANFAELYASSGGVLNCALWGVTMVITLLSIFVFIVSYGSLRTRARKGHIIFSLQFLLGVLMLLLGSRPVIALPVIGLAAVPLIHTLFVKRKGVLNVTTYIILVTLTIISALL